jgi:response regulator of citrate/malate metabolism
MRRVHGKPKTIKELSKEMRVHYMTARKYVMELCEAEKIKLYKNITKPQRYYVPLRKEDERK